MAWPPTVSSITGLNATGYLHVVWGTDGALPLLNGASTPTGAMIVDSIEADDQVEPIYLPNGSGINIGRYLLVQGRRLTIHFTDDTGLTGSGRPAIGSTLAVFDPLSRSNAMTFTVIENKNSASTKNPAKRQVVVETMTGVDGLPTA